MGVSSSFTFQSLVDSAEAALIGSDDKVVALEKALADSEAVAAHAQQEVARSNIAVEALQAQERDLKLKLKEVHYCLSTYTLYDAVLCQSSIHRFARFGCHNAFLHRTR